MTQERKSLPMRQMHSALELAESGQYREAFNLLLWCFDHGLKHDHHFRAVRLSFLIGYIADITATIPEARLVMAERLTACETLLERGFAFPDTQDQLYRLQEYVALSESFGNRERSIATLQRLLQLGVDRLGGDKHKFVVKFIEKQKMSLQGPQMNAGS